MQRTAPASALAKFVFFDSNGVVARIISFNDADRNL